MKEFGFPQTTLRLHWSAEFERCQPRRLSVVALEAAKRGNGTTTTKILNVSSRLSPRIR